jgi:hypothetical protein
MPATASTLVCDFQDVPRDPLPQVSPISIANTRTLVPQMAAFDTNAGNHCLFLVAMHSNANSTNIAGMTKAAVILI